MSWSRKANYYQNVIVEVMNVNIEPVFKPWYWHIMMNNTNNISYDAHYYAIMIGILAQISKKCCVYILPALLTIIA